MSAHPGRLPLCLVLTLFLAAPRVGASAAAKNSAQETKSLATDWLPAGDHPFRKYARVTLILGFGAAGIEPPLEEVKAELESFDAPGRARRLIAAQKLAAQQDAAVILDCPGPRSAALAVALAEQAGFQPVPLLNGLPSQKGADGAAMTFAALTVLRSQGAAARKAAPAPPAFFLDRSRLAPGAQTKGKLILPTPEVLERGRIARMLYVFEKNGAADQRDIAADIAPRLEALKHRVELTIVPLPAPAE
jgi:hypothetical protein